MASSVNRTEEKPLRVAIVAGEESGDILAAGLMRHLNERYPNVRFEGVGGLRMQAQGLRPVFPMERLSVMGLVEVLKRLPELLIRRKKLIHRWLADPPDVFIGVDAPDFNIGLEAALKSAGIPTVHYVSPSVWAWRQKRLEKINRAVDTLLCFLPFEARFYEKTQVQARFIGHPLASILPPDLEQTEARRLLGLKEDQPVVCLMPGSRRSEVDKLLKDFLATARWLQDKRPEVQFVLPAANDARYQQLESLLAEFASPLSLNLTLLRGEAQTALVASDAVLIASGTATLEAMLCRCPMVVAYRMAGLSYAIISRMLRTPYVALPNLLADEPLVPEILQNEVRAEVLGPLLLRTLDDQPYRQHLLDRFEQLSDQLRLDADVLAADAVIDLLKQRGRP